MASFVVIREHHYVVDADSGKQAIERVESLDGGGELDSTRITYSRAMPISSPDHLEDSLLDRFQIEGSDSSGVVSEKSAQQALVERD